MAGLSGYVIGFRQSIIAFGAVIENQEWVT
jgi:hypothetical protein